MNQRTRTFAFDFAALLMGANLVALVTGPIGTTNPLEGAPWQVFVGLMGLLLAVQVAGVRIYGLDEQMLASIRGLGLGATLQATGVVLAGSAGMGIVATHILLLGFAYGADMLMVMNDRRTALQEQKSAA